MAAVGTGAALVPVTGGTSLAASALVTTAAGTTISTGVILTALSIGGIAFVYTIYKGYNVRVTKTDTDGNVTEVHLERK